LLSSKLPLKSSAPGLQAFDIITHRVYINPINVKPVNYSWEEQSAGGSSLVFLENGVANM
jgi:hypothetical protein